MIKSAKGDGGDRVSGFQVHKAGPFRFNYSVCGQLVSGARDAAGVHMDDVSLFFQMAEVGVALDDDVRGVRIRQGPVAVVKKYVFSEDLEP